jgi:hypothetical protein
LGAIVSVFTLFCDPIQHRGSAYKFHSSERATGCSFNMFFANEEFSFAYKEEASMQPHWFSRLVA